MLLYVGDSIRQHVVLMDRRRVSPRARVGISSSYSLRGSESNTTMNVCSTLTSTSSICSCNEIELEKDGLMFYRKAVQKILCGAINCILHVHQTPIRTRSVLLSFVAAHLVAITNPCMHVIYRYSKHSRNIAGTSGNVAIDLLRS